MAERRITKAGALRVAMLLLIAVISLGSAVGVADPDLWIPFVCIIAVMGIGTRGGLLDKLPFVLIEAFVVAMLGVATFSGSRDFIWAASVAVSLLAVGKIALLELTRDTSPLQDVAGTPASTGEQEPEGPRRAGGQSTVPEARAHEERHIEPRADASDRG